MSSGYGSRIYLKNKSFFSLRKVLIILIIAISITVITLNLKNKREPGDNKEQKNIVTTDIQNRLYNESEKKNEVVEEDFKHMPYNQDKTPIINKKKNKTYNPEKRITPNQNKNFEILGNKNFALGKYRKAIEYYSKALRANISLNTRIGISYFRLGRYEEALKFLSVSEEKDLYPFLTKKYLAFSYYQLNNISKSYEYCKTALDLRKDEELTRFLSKLNREKEVMDDYGGRSSGRFLVQFSKVEHTILKEMVLDILKEAYREVGNEIDYFPQKKIVVILYNEKNFFDVTRAPGWAGGLYDGKIRLPVRGAEHKPDLLKRVLIHEYVHVLVSRLSGACPLWINEGLAEYFSENEKPQIGQIIPLRHIEKRFPSGNTRAVAIAYLESYSAVKFLIEKYGLFKMVELLKNLKNKSLKDSFQEVFYKSYNDFISNWGRSND